MKNYEAITKSMKALANFLDVVQEDALEAEGCSLDLTMPEQEYIDWEAWLQAECSDPDGVLFLKGRVI